MSIQVSEKAKQAFVEPGVGDDKFLRIRVVSGGCSGSTYTAAVDDELDVNDVLVHEEDDFRIVADLESVVYVDGMHIDYSDDLVQSGFRLTNPRATKSRALSRVASNDMMPMVTLVLMWVRNPPRSLKTGSCATLPRIS